MRKTILITISAIILISCQNGKMKSGNNGNSGISYDTIQFPLRILPDNGWFLKLYPNLKYEYLYFSGFSSGFETIEKGTYELNDKRIVFISGNKKSEFDTMNYYLYKKTENGIVNKNCIIDKSEKYCLIIEDE